jgi:hypothetical protein
LTVVLDGIAESLEHAASMVGRALDGSYRASDAFDDLAECSARAAKLGVTALAGLVAAVVPPTRAGPNPTSVTREVALSPEFTDRPLTLKTSGLRAIGLGSEIRIYPGPDITFTPKQVTGGERVTVTVSFLNVPAADKARTLVYEGEIVADEFQGGIVGTIRVPKPAH